MDLQRERLYGSIAREKATQHADNLSTSVFALLDEPRDSRQKTRTWIGLALTAVAVCAICGTWATGILNLGRLEKSEGVVLSTLICPETRCGEGHFERESAAFQSWCVFESVKEIFVHTEKGAELEKYQRLCPKKVKQFPTSCLNSKNMVSIKCLMDRLVHLADGTKKASAFINSDIILAVHYRGLGT